MPARLENANIQDPIEEQANTPSRLAATPSIAIIGKGFCGTIAFVRLVKKLQEKIEDGSLPWPEVKITLVEKESAATAGTAFKLPQDGEDERVFLLNGTAGTLSAFPEDPNNFVDFLTRKTGKEPDPKSVVSRSKYREYLLYLESSAYAAAAKSEGRIVVSNLKTEVEDITPTDRGIVITSTNTSAQDPTIADSILLSTGHIRKTDFEQFSDNPRFFRGIHTVAEINGLKDHWNRSDVALFIGSGASMLDAVAAFEHAGFPGRYIVISDTGFLPVAWVPNSSTDKETVWPPRGGTSLSRIDVRSPLQGREIDNAIDKDLSRAAEQGISRELLIDTLIDDLGDLWSSNTDEDNESDLLAAKRRIDYLARNLSSNTKAIDKVHQLRDQGNLEVFHGRALETKSRFDPTNNRFILTTVGSPSGDTFHIQGNFCVHCAPYSRGILVDDSPLMESKKILGRGFRFASLLDQNLFEREILDLCDPEDLSETVIDVDEDQKCADGIYAVGPNVSASPLRRRWGVGGFAREIGVAIDKIIEDLERRFS